MKIKRKRKEENIEVSKTEKTSEKTNAEKSLIDKIEDDLEKEGIVLFDNRNVVNEYLILPNDITEVDSRELGKYFNAFTQQKMWTRTLIGRLSATIREKHRELDELKAQIFSELPAKMSVKEKELRFQTNKEARNALDEIVVYEEKLNILNDYLENLDDGIFNISREISRRTSDWENVRREDNISKMRRRR